MINAKKVRTIHLITLFVLTFILSAAAFFAMNCFITTIFNYESKFNYPIIFATLPHLILIIEITSFIVGFVRMIKYDRKYLAHHGKIYSIQFIVYSSLAIIFTILAGLISYRGNFLIDNPFPGVLIVLLVFNIIVLGLAIYFLTLSSKGFKNGGEVRHSSHMHRFWTVLLVLFVTFAFNRFGAFWASFIYMDYNQFGLLFPFFISLNIPMVILVFFLLEYLGVGFKTKLSKNIDLCICFVLGITSAIYSIYQCRTNPLFISLSSAAMPLERIATLPIDQVLLFGVCIILPIVKIVFFVLPKKNK